MKRALLAVILAGSLLVACDSGPAAPEMVVDDFSTITVTAAVSGFTKISATERGQLFVRQTGTESLTVTAGADVMPLLRFEVRAGVLELGPIDGATIDGVGIAPLIYNVTVASLDEIVLTDLTGLDAQQLDTDTLRLNLDDVAGVTLSGRADSFELTHRGYASFNSEGLSCRSVTVELEGEVSAVIHASDRLAGTVSAGCVLEYTGDPIVSVTGAGTVRRR